MQSAEEILKEKLSKRVLSNKATREGVLACFVSTLSEYLADRGHPETEEEVRKRVYDTACDAFRAIGVDFEFPCLEDLRRVKEILEERFDMTSVKNDAPGLFMKYERICNDLFERYEE